MTAEPLLELGAKVRECRSPYATWTLERIEGLEVVLAYSTGLREECPPEPLQIPIADFRQRFELAPTPEMNQARDRAPSLSSTCAASPHAYCSSAPDLPQGGVNA